MQARSSDSQPAAEPEALGLVKRWIAAFNAHDAAEIVALYGEDAELFDPGMQRPRVGQAEISRWFQQRFQQMPTIRYTPTRFFEHAEGAGVCWIAEGQTPPLLRQRWLSKPFQVDGVSIFVVRAEQIVWQHGYYDHLQIAQNVLPFLRWLPLKQ